MRCGVHQAFHPRSQASSGGCVQIAAHGRGATSLRARPVAPKDCRSCAAACASRVSELQVQPRVRQAEADHGSGASSFARSESEHPDTYGADDARGDAEQRADREAEPVVVIALVADCRRSDTGACADDEKESSHCGERTAASFVPAMQVIELDAAKHRMTTKRLSLGALDLSWASLRRGWRVELGRVCGGRLSGDGLGDHGQRECEYMRARGHGDTSLHLPCRGRTPALEAPVCSGLHALTRRP